MSVPRINSRDKGAKGERDVAAYFRLHGGPLCGNARRRVSSGWSNTATSNADQGDIAGVPWLCLQVKALARPLTGKLLADTWIATHDQAEALSLDTGRRHYPVIIEKRAGAADVGRWYAHLASGFYVEVVVGRPQLILQPHLVRVELGDLMPHIRIWLSEQTTKIS